MFVCIILITILNFKILIKIILTSIYLKTIVKEYNEIIYQLGVFWFVSI